MPFSGSREAQPGGQRWVGAMSPALGLPTGQSLDLHSRPDIPLVVTSDPCSRPPQPTGQFFPASCGPPSCSLFLSWDQTFANGELIVPASGGRPLAGFLVTGPPALLLARQGTYLASPGPPFPQPSHLEEVNR